MISLNDTAGVARQIMSVVKGSPELDFHDASEASRIRIGVPIGAKMSFP